MQKNLHLETTRNWYFLVALSGGYLVVILALSMLVMPLWLHLVLCAGASLSFIPSLLRQLTGTDIQTLHIYNHRLHGICISLPERKQQPTSWKVTWRSRRLVVFVFFFGRFRLPRTLWVSPHSLLHSEQHRQVRIISRFYLSSAQAKKTPLL